MSISAKLVSELREKTGVGLMECKKVLVETEGNIEDAIKKLREKGLAKAAKKSDRSTNEGRIFLSVDNTSKKATIIELNCETDFVGSNEEFSTCGQQFCSTILSNNIDSLESLKSTAINNKSFEDFIAEYVIKLGENIGVKKVETINNMPYVASYVHMNGKIGTLVAFSDTLDDETAKSIAMHIAAANPSYLNPENVDQKELENEKAIIKNQAIKEGKPEAIVDKIVEGRISKFYKDVCLTEQPYIKDDKKSVKEVLPKEVEITHFIRYSLS